MDKNRRRVLNIIRKMDLRDEEAISELLEKKGFYLDSNTFPLSSLHFELTTKCNLFCHHCYNASGNTNLEPDRMTPEKWIEFSRYLVQRGGVFECLLSGGEPFLLGRKLFEIMDILHDDGTIFTLITNGYFMTNEFAEKLKNYRYHWLQVSIDGSDSEYHDGFRNCVGSWERAVETAKVISGKGIPLKIASCVTPYNLGSVKEMLSLAYSVGASSIILGEICLSGRTAENTQFLLSNEQRAILQEEIKEANAEYGKRMIIKTSNKVKRGLEIHADRPRSGAIIRPNGDIRIDGMAPFVIGNVLSDDFETVWENKIDSCWKDDRVTSFIDGFDEDDRNYDYINYSDSDIYL